MMYTIETSPYSSPVFSKDKWPELDWQKFSALWPLAEAEKPESSYYMKEGPCRLTDEEVMGLISMGIKVSITPYPGAMISKMQDRAKWEHSLNPLPEHIRSGAAVQIAIPDLGLMRINEVKVVEDYCTEELQGELDQGWRLLAVCPPNAARRPDYILGRTK